MKKEVIIATQNKGKVKEFEQLFSDVGWTVRSLLDYPDIPDVIEDGSTFAENAAKKAETIAKAFGEMVIADDSGLIVDALDGRPGIYSARYAGAGKSDAANNRKSASRITGCSQVESEQHVLLVQLLLQDQTLKRSFTKVLCEGVIAREQSWTEWIWI